jgi:hypothetical protein
MEQMDGLNFGLCKEMRKNFKFPSDMRRTPFCIRLYCVYLVLEGVRLRQTALWVKCQPANCIGRAV